MAPENRIAAENARTLAGLFRERVRRSPDKTAYRYFARREDAWRALTWAELARQVARWQAALERAGLKAGERVAIMLRNCPEWVVFDQAALGLGLISVPLYPDDRPDNIAYILRETASKLLVLEGARQEHRLQEALRELPGVALLNLDRLDAWLPAEFDPAPRALDSSPDSLASIVYTSGTTGRPKGVMLSHRNILTNTAAAASCEPFHEDDVFLSFLPLSHMFERTAGYYLPMLVGAEVAYARSVQQLAGDLQSVRPTVLISVPRIYEQVHAKVQRQLEAYPSWKRALFAQAVARGWQMFEYRQGRAGWRPGLLLQPFLQRIAGKPVLDKLGGRLRLAVCGGAPLSPAVARFFIGLGLPLCQGYGLTETSPVISVNRPRDNLPASIGTPLPEVEIKLGENDELLSRGPCVMQGYWRNPEATAAALDAEGWFHTGDRAHIDAQGHVYLTGRIKDIIVLSNGEKVPPQDIEMAIAADPLFEQVMLLGEGRACLAALAVLNQDAWRELAADLRIDPQALADKAAEKAVLRRIAEHMRAFPGYAQVRRVALFLEPWSVENGLLTPTLKLKRARVLERHRAEIEALYATLE